jgi:hypothetical protein
MMKTTRVSLLGVAALAAILCLGRTAEASPAYSFEDMASGGPDGFFGLGAAVSQDTIGVTDGRFSMKYLAGAGGFVGARTETVIPAGLNNPPGVKSVQFDMAIVDIPVGLTFADMGVTVFGHDIDGGTFGIQHQFTDTISIVGLGVGQHLNLEIDLDSEFFSGQSFNELFGDDVSDLDVASAFQFYMSKTAGVPATVYIDNVRLVIPEPTTGVMFGLAAMLASVVLRHR